MFRKLVSNISFSPALVGQLGFYARRLKKEEATRRVGLIFTVLALVVQSFAVFNAPISANAASSNDFVKGGVTSKSQYLSYYDKNYNGLKDIYNALGVTRAEISNATEGKTIYSASKNPTYYSWGRNAKFSASQGERKYNFQKAGGGTVAGYARPLKLWGTYSPRVMIGHSAKLGWFAIMYDCGNLVTISYPVIQKCPTHYTGVYPNCKAPTCPAGTTGTYPNCKTPTCPTGTTGTYPNCNKLTCPKNTTGTYPDCKPITCPTGTTGTYPNCKEVPCQYNSTIAAKDSECQPCPGDSSIWIKDKDCAAELIPSKTAINITQDSKDATTVSANAGDKIEYHINIKNTGKATATAKFSEELLDVSQYASIIDTGGGTYSKDSQTLTWPDVPVEPGKTVTRIFTVQISTPIPAASRGTSDRDSFDCKMLNTFGNAVEVNINCPAAKTVEQVTTELPHTGATENMLFAGGLFAVVVYFYARSRQLKKEVRLIRRNINTGTI